MSALRLGGRLTVGTQTFSVQLTNAGGKPEYVVRALARPGSRDRTPNATIEANSRAQAAALAKRLANRHAQFGDRVHRFCSDRHVADLCRAFAISPDLNVLPFREFLAKCEGGTKLQYGGQDYYVHVEPGKQGMSGATATLVPVAQASSVMARLGQVLRCLFPHSSDRPSVRTLERLLTGAIRTYHARSNACGDAPSPDAGRARVQAALRAAAMARACVRNVRPDLRGANLAGVDLTGLNLNGAVLRDADLRGANLANVSLLSADLSGANLADADLTDGQMAYARLCGANLTNARLSRGALQGADLSDANMVGATLLGANLDRASLERADLSDAAVSFATFSEARMDHALLRDCSGTRPEFINAQLSNTNFHGAYIADGRFRNADLKGASFRNAKLGNASFSGARLSGAEFSHANVRNARFDRVDVGDGKCLETLALQPDNDLSIVIHDVDDAFAQLKQDGGPLRYLPSSPGRRRAILTYLMALADACAGSLHRVATLRDWLLDHPNFATEPLHQMVLGPYQEARRSGNVRPLAWPESAPLLPGLMRDAIEALNARDGAAWGRANAGLLMQLAFLAERPDAPSSAAERKTALMQAYRETLPPTLVEAAARVELRENDRLFPVVSDAGDDVLLVASEYYSCLVRGESPAHAAQGAQAPSWMAMYRLNAAVDPDTGDRRYIDVPIGEPSKDLAACRLLRIAYTMANASSWHDKLVAVLPFGEAYREDFQLALLHSLAIRRLVDEATSLELLDRANEVLIGERRDIHPAPAHLKALLDIMPGDRNDRACQSYFLWCVAAVLTRLTSKDYFGEEKDTPYGLRAYAAGLCNAATSIASASGQHAMHKGWVKALLGNDCTQLLSAEMIHTLSEQGTESFRTIFTTVCPPKWRR